AANLVSCIWNLPVSVALRGLCRVVPAPLKCAVLNLPFRRPRTLIGAPPSCSPQVKKNAAAQLYKGVGVRQHERTKMADTCVSLRGPARRRGVEGYGVKSAPRGGRARGPRGVGNRRLYSEDDLRRLEAYFSSKGGNENL